MSPPCAQCGYNDPARAAACPQCGAPAAEVVEQAGAVAELVGYEKRRGHDLPKEISNLYRRALNAAEGFAAQLGGDLVAVRPDLWEATFGSPGGAHPAAAAATEWAQRVRAAVRDYAGASTGREGRVVAVRLGVDAGETGDLAPGDTPLASARRLKAKAAGWEVLAGENLVALTSNRFKFRPVGFFQSRGGRAVIKVYRLVEEAPKPTRVTTSGGQLRVPQGDYEKAFTTFIAAAIDGSGPRHLRITGGSGSGKTTALELCGHIARSRGLKTLATTCYLRRRSEPYGAWTPLWRQLFAGLGGPLPEAVGSALRKLGADAAVWTPVFEKLAGYDASDNPYVRGAPPALRRQAVRDVTFRLVAAAAAREPLVFLWDDVDAGDPSSRALMREFLAKPSEHAVAVIYSSPDEDALHVGPETTFATRPFSRAELEDVARAAGPYGDMLAVFEWGRGDPAVTAQLWRLLQETPAAVRALPAAAETSRLATVTARRWQTKGKEWRRMTAALAALGLPLTADDAEAWGRAAGGGRGFDAAGWVVELQSMGILTKPLGESAAVWRVAPHLSQTLTGTLAPAEEDRVRAANAGARFLEERMPRELAAAAALELEAANYAGAASCAFAQADVATWLDSRDEETEQLTRIITAGESKPGSPAISPRIRAHAYYRRAAAEYAAGAPDEALRDLGAATLWAEPDLNAPIPLLRGRVLAAAGRQDDAQAAFRQAADIAGAGGRDDLAAEAKLELAWLWLRRGETDKAAAVLTPVAAAPAHYYAGVAEINLRAGRVLSAARAAEAAWALADESAAPVTAAAVAAAVAAVAFERGRFSQYRHLLRKSRAIWARVGDRGRELDSLIGGAALDTLTAPVAEGEAAWFAVLEKARAVESAPAEAAAAVGLAQAALLKNDGEAAARWLARGRENAEKLDARMRAALNLTAAQIQYFGLNASEGAKTRAENAAREFAAAGDVPQSLRAGLFAARVALDTAVVGDATVWLRREDVLRFAQESRPFFAAYGHLEGRRRIAVGDDALGLKFLRAATAAARELGLWLTEAECLRELAAAETHAERREGLDHRARWLGAEAGARLFTAATAPSAG